MHNGILIGGLVFYGVVPLVMELNKDDFIGRKNYFDMGVEKYVLTYFIITLFFTIFYFSNHSSFRKKSFVYAPSENKFNKNLKRFGYFCLFVGGVSLILFFGALGGLSSALAIAERARSFSTSLTDFMPYYASLLVVPARLITVAPFCFWILMYYSDKQGKKEYKFHVVISFVLSALFYLFNAGRAQILAMLLCLVVPIMLNMRVKHAWRYIIIVAIMSLPMLDVLDQLFIYMQNGTFELGETTYLSYISQFSVPIKNVFYSFEIGNTYGYRYGLDFVTSILDLVPGLNFEPSYLPTSEFYGGAGWKITGGTPNDLITLSILEFHVLGIIIIPFILGKASKFLDEFIRNCADIRVSRVLATVFSVYSFLLIQSADPVAVFRAFILWMIPLIMIMSKCKTIQIGTY